MEKMRKLDPEMMAEEVVQLLRLFEEYHLEVSVDGGWAVDALLGDQTRAHADLDIAMPHKYVGELRAVLELHGYREVLCDQAREYNFVMGDGQGHLVDIHTYTFDEHGELVFGEPYPVDSLDGQGSILGCPVRCITPEWLVKFHTGYELNETDYHDVMLLCERFGLEIPVEYEQFTRKKNQQVQV